MSKDSDSPYVYICDGQGAVEPNMGKKLYSANSRYRANFDQISHICDQDIASLCWGKERFKLKSNPYYAHLGLLANEYSQFQILTDEDKYPPAYITGHSLGEIFAYIFSGALSLTDGALLVKSRGKLFLECAENNNSDMVNLAGEPSDLELFLEGISNRMEVYTCNYNNQRNIVVSLKKADIPVLVSEAASQKIRAVKLNLNNGCHSPLISGINKEINVLIESIEFHTPVYPMFSGSTSRELNTPYLLKSNLKEHLLSPVYWGRSIKVLIDRGYTDFIEIGTSRVLKGILLGIDPQLNIMLAANLV